MNYVKKSLTYSYQIQTLNLFPLSDLTVLNPQVKESIIFIVHSFMKLCIAELSNMASTNILPDNTDNTAGQTADRPSPKKPLNRVASFYTPYMEDRLRRKLKFYFMGPHEKIIAKRKCPWKLLLQIFKVVIVTVQVRLYNLASLCHEL